MFITFYGVQSQQRSTWALEHCHPSFFFTDQRRRVNCFLLLPLICETHQRATVSLVQTTYQNHYTWQDKTLPSKHNLDPLFAQPSPLNESTCRGEARPRRYVHNMWHERVCFCEIVKSHAKVSKSIQYNIQWELNTWGSWTLIWTKPSNKGALRLRGLMHGKAMGQLLWLPFCWANSPNCSFPVFHSLAGTLFVSLHFIRQGRLLSGPVSKQSRKEPAIFCCSQEN